MWPETWTTVSGCRVPQNTRTRLTRPTYGSVVVRTTSATSGPSGSHCSGGSARPAGVIAVGSGCIVGDGNAAEIRSSSSPRPTPEEVDTGRTG